MAIFKIRMTALLKIKSCTRIFIHQIHVRSAITYGLTLVMFSVRASQFVKVVNVLFVTAFLTCVQL